jgi:uncharacterized protein (TIGR00299 family) protein
MKIAYLECFAGIAGDMFLGALVDAGVEPRLLQDAADSLNLGVQLEFKKVDRSGIQATKARVLLNGVDADSSGTAGVHVQGDSDSHSHSHDHQHEHHDGLKHEHSHEHAETHVHTHTHTDEHGHTHTHTHAHTHAEQHVHGRSLSEIRHLIGHAAITPHAKEIALLAFNQLGAAEAKIHGMPIEKVHFHEVGAVDAIIDIVCGAVGADALGVEEFYCSAVNTGSGFVDCAHGRFPVPAPATLELLQGVPIYAEGPPKEMTTPTGAALIRALSCRFDPIGAMQTDRTGYGAGTRNPERFPNVLRLRIGTVKTARSIEYDTSRLNDTVAVLECAIDDATPEVLASAAQLLLEHGALDVMQQPATMKKGRLGTLLTVICKVEDARHIEYLLFRETSTLGIRFREEQRSILTRSTVEVSTEYGVLRVKTGSLGNDMMNAAPEFEDCRTAARLHNTPLKQVLQAASAAYREQLTSAAGHPDGTTSSR